MRSYSAFNLTAIDKPHVTPIKLIKIEFDGLTLYLCDRNFGSVGSENTFNNQIYEPLILSYDEIKYGEIGKNEDPGSPGEFSFVVDNKIPIGDADSFVALFSTYDPIYSKVTLYEIFDGATSVSDLITRFVGTIEDIDMSIERVAISCTSYEISVMNKVEVEICDEDTYPGADPDDWGKILPIVYGNAKRVPMRAVDAGELTTLAADINDVITVITVTDASGFPAGGGTIQIDFEEITYQYTSGNQLVGCVRGVDRIEHYAGATVAEIQSEYFYILDHPVKSIDNVYVIHRDSKQNIIQSSDIYTIYTGQTGDEHPSYPGKAVVVFNTIPSIAPQVNLTVEDTIAVDDTIDVDDQIGVDQGDHGHGGDTYDIWHMEYGTVLSGYVDDGLYEDRSSPHNASNGDIGNYAAMYHPGTSLKIESLYAKEGTGVPTYYRICMVLSWLDTGVRCRFTWDGNYIQSAAGAAGIGTTKGSWIATTKNWTQINALTGTLSVINAGSSAGVVHVRDAWIEIIHSEVESGPATGVDKTGDATKTGAATKTGTVTLTGNSVADTVIGGRVSVDVQGWQADDSGDYGAEGSLIERPDYILKHFLTNYCPLTVADNIDSTSYDASGTLYANDYVALAVVLQEPPDVAALLSSIAFQCKSIEFWEEGKHHLVRIPVSDTTDKTIDKERIDIASVKVAYTPRAEVLNAYVGSYFKHWIGDFESSIESYREIEKVTSDQSIAIFGNLEANPIEFPFIISSAQVIRVLNWLLDDNDFPRLIVEFSGGHHLSDLQRGDVIDFRFNSGDELDRMFLGLVESESDQFRIMDMQQDEKGKFTITAYFEVSSRTASGTFYPSQNNDDGYTQGANFYNTTVANVIGNYTGDPYTSTTTTTVSTTTTTSTSTTTTT